MTVRFRSSTTDPYERGVELGRTFSGEIAETVAAYRVLFGDDIDLGYWGALALKRIAEWAPHLAAEIDGIANGAGLPAHEIAAINARTEILAAARVAAHECSTVVRLSPDSDPVSVQCWDWYAALAHLWFVWEIPQADGGITTTVTEFGIVGKIGVNDRGLGLHVNILHHAADGNGMGVPVHVLARSVLDGAHDLNQALTRIAAAPVSASTALTVVASSAGESAAVSCELNPDRIGYSLPDADGLLLHTNHFLSSPACLQDTELRGGPDTVVRYDMLRRRLARAATPTIEDTVAALNSHLLGGGATCCHIDESLPTAAQYATLATVVLDVAAGTLTAHAGGPCTHPESSRT